MKLLVDRLGPWTAHNIHLGGGLYTMGNYVVGSEIKLRRIAQMISDIANVPIKELRILDLACLEGLYSIELARQGASVLGIEGREVNVEKARFCKDVLSLSNVEFVQDDVRSLSKERYGEFDVVLCLGILYHLDVPDVFKVLEEIASVCRRFVVIDTHVSMSDRESVLYKDQTYWGMWYNEHPPTSTPEERRSDLWASLDNLRSFWFTRSSLFNVLSDVGFGSVYECHNPPEVKKPLDRLTLLGIKSRPIELRSCELVNGVSQDRWPEKLSDAVNPSQRAGSHDAVNTGSGTWYSSMIRKLLARRAERVNYPVPSRK
jgi:SAM-dependent methyltransferase